MIVKLNGSSHPGYQRKKNEDFYVIEDNPYPLMMVADGVSGERKGEVASELASQAIIAHLYNYLKTDFSRNKVNFLLKEIFDKVNLLVYKAGKGSPDFQGMCTTLTLSLIYNKKLFVAHVGDSQAFIIRKSRIITLTKPHTLAHFMKIKTEDHPFSHVLTQVIGQKKPLLVEARSVVLNNEDIIVLCTDGLGKYVSTREIKKIAISSDVHDLPEMLIGAALAKGGHDNITVAVGFVEELEANE
ncbi:MAG: Serine/threonine phosphatase stp [candidate division WS2 bacterium]|uniref:Serine/threonine phosphatase stp n=1 Tax=Psychracetigena formicireducens TaxID=2986056 RepID=A0A9E2BGV5_PSYF1|nr:Serine/threonine phosphatase stp [Candidatus Psychracetigena formicireducens]MBT9144799.1 Serine/threonine phosphatase stp [Candidatus Psychracetigena formicireducens]MBT9149942.1 Serine/threonine phosphatase stp [Candidatus Psychracetigena formicireducens]